MSEPEPERKTQTSEEIQKDGTQVDRELSEIEIEGDRDCET